MIQTLKFWQGIFAENDFLTSNLDGVDLTSTSDSITPLSLSIFYHSKIVSEYIINSGINIRQQDDEAFCMAAIRGDLHWTHKLLELGADINAVPNIYMIHFLFKYDSEKPIPHAIVIHRHDCSDLNHDYSGLSRFGHIDFGYDYMVLGKHHRSDYESNKGNYTNLVLYAAIISATDENYQMYDLLVTNGINQRDFNDKLMITLCVGYYPTLSRQILINDLPKLLATEKSLTPVELYELCYLSIAAREHKIIEIIDEHTKMISDRYHRQIHTWVTDESIRRLINSLEVKLGNPDVKLEFFIEEELTVLIWCIENEYVDHTYYHHAQCNIFKYLSKYHSNQTHKLLKLAHKINLDTQPHLCMLMIQAMYFNDKALLETIAEMTEIDNLILQLRDSN